VAEILSRALIAASNEGQSAAASKTATSPEPVRYPGNVVVTA
jgi:hypothetical protein